MKHKFTKVFVFAALLAGLLSACQDQLSMQHAAVESDIRSAGRKVGTDLSVMPMENQPETKSAYTGSDAAVKNWTLLQFDAEEADGHLVGAYYQGSSSNISNIRMQSDHRYNFYAVANLGDIRGEFTVGASDGTLESTMASWNATKDYSSGSAKAITMSNVTALPMSWKSSSPIAFTAAQLREGAQIDVVLMRLVGRYDIRVNTSGLSAWRFAATGVTVKGPSAVTPFAASSAVRMTPADADRSTNADITGINNGNAVTYYPLENRYGNLLSSNSTAAGKTQDAVSAASATATPTYVEVSGTLTKTDGSDLSRTVKYRFYLGDGDAAATKNFDVVRNRQHVVTMVLTDAAIDDPYWKVEPGVFTDTRDLRFEDDIIRVDAGSSTAENIIREVDGQAKEFQYKIILDPALAAVGVTVQVGGSDYNGGAVNAGQITIVAPAGLSFTTGTIRIETLDGEKYDEATVAVGKGLVAVKVIPVKLGSVAATYPYIDDLTEVTADIDPTAAAYEDTDFTVYRTTSGNALYQYGYRIFAVYSDGTWEEITDSYSSLPNSSGTSKDSGDGLVLTAGASNSAGFDVGYVSVTKNTYSGTTAFNFRETNAATSGVWHLGTMTLSATYTKDGITRTGSSVVTWANTVRTMELDIPTNFQKNGDGNVWIPYSPVTTAKLTAYAVYFDGSRQDISSEVTWSLSTSSYNADNFNMGDNGNISSTGVLYRRSEGVTEQQANLTVQLPATAEIMTSTHNYGTLSASTRVYVYVTLVSIRATLDAEGLVPAVVYLDELDAQNVGADYDGDDATDSQYSTFHVWGYYSDGQESKIVLDNVTYSVVTNAVTGKYYFYGLEREEDDEDVIDWSNQNLNYPSVGVNVSIFRYGPETGWYGYSPDEGVETRYLVKNGTEASYQAPHTMIVFQKTTPNGTLTAEVPARYHELDRIEFSPAKKMLTSFREGNYSYNTADYVLTAYYTDGTTANISGYDAVSWDADGNKAYFKDANGNYKTLHDNASYMVKHDTYVTVRQYLVDGSMTSSYYAGDVNDASTWREVPILSASYTVNGVTKSASVMGTLENFAPVTGLQLSPATAKMYMGTSQIISTVSGQTGQLFNNFTATASFEGAPSKNVTSDATWTCGTKLTSNGGGAFTAGYTAGNETVTASYTHLGETKTATATVQVVGPSTVTLQYYDADNGEWVSGSQTVNKGRQQQYRVVVTYTDGATKTLTDGFTLTSSNTTVMPVSGVRTTAAAAGTANVTATFGGVTSNAIAFTVRDNEFTYKLVVSPKEDSSSPLGYLRIYPDAGENSVQFKAYYERYDHGVLDTSFGTNGRQDVSSSATWTVTDDSGYSWLPANTWTAGTHTFTCNTSSFWYGRIAATYNGLTDSAHVCSGKSGTTTYTYRIAVLAENHEGTYQTNEDSSPYVIVATNAGVGLKAEVQRKASGSSKWNAVADVTSDFSFALSNTIATGWSISGSTLTTTVGTGTIGGTYTGADTAYQGYDVVSVNVYANPEGGGGSFYWRWTGNLRVTGASAITYGSTEGYVLEAEVVIASTPEGLDTSTDKEWRTVTVGDVDGSLDSGASSYGAFNKQYIGSDFIWGLTNNNSTASDYVATVTLTTNKECTSSVISGGHCEGSLPAGESASMTVTLNSRPTDYLTVSPSSLSWDSDETSSQTVSVASNVSWSVTCSNSSDWNVSPASGSGNGTVTVSPKAANTSTSADKTATLTFSATGVSDVTVDLSQARKAEEVTYRVVTSVSPSTVSATGTATASAMLQSKTGSGSWTDVRDVTSNVSFSSNNGIVSVSGSTLTANNTTTSSVSVSITAGSYTGSETVGSYVGTTLTVEAPVAAYPVSMTVTATPSIIQPGGTSQMSARVTWSDGTVTTPAASDVSWSTTRDDAAGDGAVSAQGVFTTDYHGTYTVTGSFTANGHTVTADAGVMSTYILLGADPYYNPTNPADHAEDSDWSFWCGWTLHFTPTGDDYAASAMSGDGETAHSVSYTYTKRYEYRVGAGDWTQSWTGDGVTDRDFVGVVPAGTGVYVRCVIEVTTYGLVGSSITHTTFTYTSGEFPYMTHFE